MPDKFTGVIDGKIYFKVDAIADAYGMTKEEVINDMHLSSNEEIQTLEGLEKLSSRLKSSTKEYKAILEDLNKRDFIGIKQKETEKLKDKLRKLIEMNTAIIPHIDADISLAHMGIKSDNFI